MKHKIVSLLFVLVLVACGAGEEKVSDKLTLNLNSSVNGYLRNDIHQYEMLIEQESWYSIKITVISGNIQLKVKKQLTDEKILDLGRSTHDVTQANIILPIYLRSAEKMILEFDGTQNAQFQLSVLRKGLGTEAMPALAKQSGCSACHHISKRVVGPAWNDVALRYRDGDANAIQQLENKIRKGGNGNWEEITHGVPMPPYSPRVNDEDIAYLVQYIFALLDVERPVNGDDIISGPDQGANQPEIDFNGSGALPIAVNDEIESNLIQNRQAYYFTAQATAWYEIEFEAMSENITMRLFRALSDNSFQSLGASVHSQASGSKAIPVYFDKGETFYIEIESEIDATFKLRVNNNVDLQTPAMPELARRNGCTACHAIEKRIVGPSWADVALMYRDDVENAKIALFNKIQSGGKGSWNNLTKGVPMPPYSPRVSDEDIGELVEFIFSIPQQVIQTP